MWLICENTILVVMLVILFSETKGAAGLFISQTSGTTMVLDY